ncbi:MAG TPA: alpha/beta fold hydrolase [Candidatus Limiplasma sp.]|nr:alpha/beta fold hydrolase [Candidatus Limiplasma sp.]
MHKASVFKSPQGRDKIRAYYNNILAMVPLAQRTIDTPYGKTFVLEAGSEAHPPLVLLHGSCSNSAAWLGDLPALAARCHIFAVDLPGEPGNSDEHRPDIEAGEYTRWLLAVLDALQLRRAALMGNSMGGWLALQFAAAYPQRTAALLLLAPSGLVKANPAFLAQTANIADDTAAAKATGEAVLGNAAMPREVLEFMVLVMEHFIPVTGTLPVLTDAQMQALTMPVLMIAGDADITMDVHAASLRLKTLVPSAQCIVQSGSHVVIGAAEQVLSFLDTVL